MTDTGRYYLENLYPMQTSVLNSIDRLGTPLFLTGGTALSREYYSHRYSDDLDLFVNDAGNFADIVENVLNEISKSKDYRITSKNLYYECCMLQLKNNDGVSLKIDIVNDIPVNHGTPHKGKNIPFMVDSVENILTNKISAIIGRNEIKDVVDLREICRHKKFNWQEVLIKALEKEASVDADFLCSALGCIRKEDFDQIHWIKKPEWNKFAADVRSISQDITRGGSNSLFRPKMSIGIER